MEKSHSWSSALAWKAGIAARLSRVRISPSPPMKIIFLNCWYAKAEKTFFDFISKNSSGADIFCLSEIYPELFAKLEGILPDFKGYYEEGIFDSSMNLVYGQAIFTRRGIEFKSLGKIKSPKDRKNEAGFAFALPLQIFVKRKKLYVVNVHGKSRPGDKLDTPARIEQSENIINFLKDKNEPVVIGGDFNLMPFTKSIKILEKTGYRNLIKDFNIKETRNRLSWEQFPNEEKQHFADYVFVSREVKVISFEVPRIEVSDHLPLILEFEV